MPSIADQDIITAWTANGMAPRNMDDIYDFLFGYDVMDAVWRIYSQDLKSFPSLEWTVQSTAWAQMQILKFEERDEKP